MIFPFWLIISTVALTPVQAVAAPIIGDDLPPSASGISAGASDAEIADSVCRILFYDSKQQLSHMCSGTLISATEVTTADHCAESLKDKNSHATIQCGFVPSSTIHDDQVMTDGNHVLTTGTFKETFQSPMALIDHQRDIAKVILPENSMLNPMPILLPSQLGDLFEKSGKLKSDVECRIAGYGVDSNGRAGILHSTQILHLAEAQVILKKNGHIELAIERKGAAPSSLKATATVACLKEDESTRGFLELVDDIRKFISFSILPGDSGGPLYCRKLGMNWTLIGANQSISSFNPMNHYGENWSSLNFDHLKPVRK